MGLERLERARLAQAEALPRALWTGQAEVLQACQQRGRDRKTFPGPAGWGHLGVSASTRESCPAFRSLFFGILPHPMAPVPAGIPHDLPE